MEFLNLIEKRRSVRKFTEQEISRNEENKLLKNVLLAPSAGNLQAFGIISVRKIEIKKLLFDAALEQDPILEAPLILVFYSYPDQSAQRYGERGRELYALQDATIATTYAHLLCTDMGFGSVWIGAFDTEKVRNILKLPKNKIPIALLPIGYPNEQPEPRTRRPLNKMVERQ